MTERRFRAKRDRIRREKSIDLTVALQHSAMDAHAACYARRSALRARTQSDQERGPFGQFDESSRVRVRRGGAAVPLRALITSDVLIQLPGRGLASALVTGDLRDVSQSP